MQTVIKLKSLKTRITSNTISSRPYQAFKIHYREGGSGQAFIMVYIYVCKKFKVTCEMIGRRDGDWVNNLLQTYCKVRRILFNRRNQPQIKWNKTCNTIFWHKIFQTLCHDFVLYAHISSSKKSLAIQGYYIEGDLWQAFIMVYIYVCKKFKVACEMIGRRDGDWVNNLLQRYFKVMRTLFKRAQSTSNKMEQNLGQDFLSQNFSYTFP